MRAICSAVMPIPVSVTSNSSRGDVTVRRHPAGQVDASFLGELDGVSGQVDQDLPQPRGVALDRFGNQALDLAVQCDPGLIGPHPQDIHHVVHDAVGIGFGDFHGQLAGLDFREVQDVIDQLNQMRATAVDDVEVLQTSLFVVLHAPPQEIGKAHDGVHRRANLVAHVRQKCALRLVGHFCGLFRLAQFHVLLVESVTSSKVTITPQ